MKIITPEEFGAAGITGVFPRYFVQLWLERLDYTTPLGHQARHMTPCSLLEEIADLAGQAKEGMQVSGYLRAAAEEVVDPGSGVIACDPLLQECMPDELYLIGPLLRRLASGKGLGAKLEVLQDTARLGMEKLRTTYSALAAERILEALRADDAHETERGLRSLTGLVDGLVSHLLGEGHSPDVLFGRHKLLWLIPKGSLDERLEYFMGIARFHDLPHTVVFQLDLPDERMVTTVLQHRDPMQFGISVNRECTFSGHVPAHIRVKIDEFCKGHPTRLWLTCLVEHARDEFSAAIEAKELVRQWLLALGVRAECRGIPEPKSYCLVTQKEGPQHTRVVGFDESARLGLDPSRSPRAAAVLAEVIGKGDFWSREQALFRYLEAAREPELERSFDLYWRSLELLCRGDIGRAIIDRVVSVAAKPMALRSLSRTISFVILQLQQLHGDEVRAGPGVTLSTVPLSPPQQLQWALALADRQKAETVYDVCEGYERTRMHVLDAHNLCRSQKAIAGRLEVSRKRVEWQLRRIYRHRNMMVHEGHARKSLERLHHHLRWYVHELFQQIAADQNCLEERYLAVENHRYDTVLDDLKRGGCDLQQLFR